MRFVTLSSWCAAIIVVLPACGATQEDRVNQRNFGTADPTAHRTDEPDADGDARRARSKAALDPLEFRFAQWLPTTHHRAAVGGTLRPRQEIARRLMALHAVNLWVFASRIPDQQLIDYVDNNGLRPWFTDDERAMFESSREGIEQRFGSRMGWTQENMWSLAWALGFDMQPTPNAPLIGDSVVGPMLDFLPATTGSIDELLAHTPRSEAEVLDLEDLFYCAHNAARSAQAGESGTVPTNFHPVMNGGAVHERRHALTWMISPGVSWAETDLST